MKMSKKIQRVTGILLLVVLMTGVLLARYSSGQYWNSKKYNTVEIEIEYPDNQHLVSEKEISEVVDIFFEEELDSNVLSLNAFLLETALKELPYVMDAQVYWNMQGALRVEVLAKQVKAIVATAGTPSLLTLQNEILPKPKGTLLDLPIITGISDSASAAAAGELLKKVVGSPAFSLENLAQLDVQSTSLALVPHGYNHVVVANKDQRLEMDLKKLAAYYGATPQEELAAIKRIDLRYKNQVVTTTR